MGTAEKPDSRRAHWLLWSAVVLVVGSALLYLLIVGSHEHVLEVNTPSGTVRITSNRSSFGLSLPGVRDVQAISLRGYDGFRRSGSRIVPMQVEGVGIIRTWQQVDLPLNHPAVVFFVNGHELRLEDGKVEAAGRVWALKPGTVVEIRVDRLRLDPPAPP
jgi:hypothetical protein